MRESRIALALGLLALTISLLAAFSAIPAFVRAGFPLRTKMLIVDDASGSPRAFLTTQPDGSPALKLLDSSGVVRAELSLTPADGPHVSLCGSDGRSRVSLTLHGHNGQPELILSSPDGRKEWRIGMNESGDAPVIFERE